MMSFLENIASCTNKLIRRVVSKSEDNSTNNQFVNKENHFCTAPFLQLTLDPYGVVLPCCLRSDHPLGSVKTETLNDLWNGEQIRSYRREFLTNNIKTCAHDIKILGCNKWYSHLEQYVNREEFQTLPPRRFDLRLNGRCNLQCVMCTIWDNPNGTYDNVGFWEKGPTEIFPHLLEIDIMGGEPFVQRDTYRLIREVSAVNKDCLWIFTTNANWRFNRKLKEILDQIKIRYFHVSIDSLDPTVYPKIRKFGNLKLALQTLDDLANYRKECSLEGRSFILTVRMVVRPDNYREIPNFIRYAQERNIHPDFNFQRVPANRGGFISAPKSLQSEALHYLQDYFETTRYGQIVPIIEELKLCVANYYSSTP